MRVGVFVHVCEAESGRTLPVEEVVGAVERVEALGFDSAWVMDHLLYETPAGRVAGHDPMVLLAAAAARTRRVGLGTLVACTAFRPPGQLAREAAALADAAAGRFTLGLGAGWHQPEFEAFGLPFDRLVTRFEASATAVRRLLEGERVTMAGPDFRLDEAAVPATAPPPPIWIAGRGPRMLGLTARLADGWNLAWGGLDPSWLAEPLDGLRRALAAEGRDPSTLTVSAGVSWVPGVTAGSLTAALRDYEAAGVDVVLLSLAPGPVSRTSPEHLERAAEALARR
jgi:alkanesulfonate monooxygenase SsuD/methylene tetrahydromethanopterin reductase-like flavin-dependent oxidoreductase (luciferase family)